MRARLLMVSVLFAAAAGAAHTQPPAPSAPPAVPTAPPLLPTAPPVVPESPRVLPAVPTEEKSLERMLDQLEGLRARKADLERQEQELMTDIRKLLSRQDERVKRLGVVSELKPAVAPPPLVVPTGAGLPPFPLPSVPQPKKN